MNEVESLLHADVHGSIFQSLLHEVKQVLWHLVEVLEISGCDKHEILHVFKLLLCKE